MPVDVWIDKENGLVCRTLRDEISIDEILASLEQTVVHPDYRPGMKSLNDLRELVPQSTGNDVRKVADYLLEHATDREGLEAAVVLSRAVDCGMTRMLQAPVTSLKGRPHQRAPTREGRRIVARWVEGMDARTTPT